MRELSRYEAAKAALAEATRVDEVKDIRDKAVAMQVYAAQAKDRTLIDRATEIRYRAEIRAGELLAEMAERREREGAGGDRKSKFREGILKLADLGVTPKQSHQWQKAARLSDIAREAMVERMKAEALRSFDRTQSTEDKKERRAAREAELGRAQAAHNLEFPEDERFGVILADPEWRFEPWSRETGMDRSPDNHYPTSTTDAIASRPVEKIADENCVLFLWATAPMLPHALSVMAAWGFEYKSHMIAVKNRIGTGYWFRNEHELLLIGTKGIVAAPAMGTQWPSTREFQVGRHSEKPDWQYELIEAYFPTLPKIELNARRARPGWTAWGLDAPPHDPITGEIVESLPAIAEAAE